MDYPIILPPKHPSAQLDCLFDFASKTNGNGSSDWLGSGETIVDYVITVSTGLTLVSHELINGGTSVLVWVKDGTDGVDYQLSCAIETNTSPARKDTKVLTIPVRSSQTINESVLISIKSMLNLPIDTTGFDQQLILFINMTFMVLSQLGIGPVSPYKITGDSETWNDFDENVSLIEMVRPYVYAKVRLLFDPPTIGFMMNAWQNMITEYEQRLVIQKEIIIPNLPGE